jgi:hypothetical protein
MDSTEHIPIPRKNYGKKPTLMILSGDSMIGKTNLSTLLKTIPKSFYVSLDQITLDDKLPIKNINHLVLKWGYDFSFRSINKFLDEVYNNQEIFINYCFEFVLNKTEQFFIFDGVHFTNENFLNEFIEKFEDKFHIWVISRPIKNKL